MLAPSPYPLTPNLNLTLPLPYPALKALRERRGPRLPRRAPATRHGSSESIAESCVLPRQEESCCHGAPPSAAGCHGVSAGALLVGGSRFTEAVSPSSPTLYDSMHREDVTCVLRERVLATLCARAMNMHMRACTCTCAQMWSR